MKRVQAGAHNPERASPFLDTFFGQFFPRKWNLRHVYESIQNVGYQKGKRNVINRQKLLFLGFISFADWFVGL